MREVRVVGVPRAGWQMETYCTNTVTGQWLSPSGYRFIYMFVLYFSCGFYFDQPEFRDRFEERICQLYK